MARLAAKIVGFWALMSASVAAQTPASPPLSPEAGTTFVQVCRILAAPAIGGVQRDKTLVIGRNQVVEIRGDLIGKDEIVDLRDGFGLLDLIDRRTSSIESGCGYRR